MNDLNVMADQGTAQFFQVGGILEADSIMADMNSPYGLFGGTLMERTAGGLDLSIDGDLFIGGFGQLVVSQDTGVGISGLFGVFPEGATTGILNYERLGLFGAGDGFVSLIQVGDNSNLLSGFALDRIGLIGHSQGVRMNEDGFFDIFSSQSNTVAFALVEGTLYGSPGHIGIAYSNFAAIPEPTSLGVFVAIGLLCTLRRSRRAVVADGLS